MKKSVRILGKKAFAVWLVVIVVIAFGAGAAGGTVLARKVTSDIPVAASQALLTGRPVWQASLTADPTIQPQQVYMYAGQVKAPIQKFAWVADDKTAFEATALLNTENRVMFNLPLKNASKVGLFGCLTLSVPGGLEAEVFQAIFAGSRVTEVVRIGLNTWKFKLAPSVLSAEYQTEDSLAVLISANDTLMPGYWGIAGTIKQMEASSVMSPE